MTQDMIVDGVHYVNEAYNAGKNLISEGANAAMLDVDFGMLDRLALPAVLCSVTSFVHLWIVLSRDFPNGEMEIQL